MQRFVWLERSLHSKNKFYEFANAMVDYFEMGHAKLVPSKDLDRPCEEVFYLPMQVVSKVSSTTTRLHVVFDASTKTKSGLSLNDQLLVGLTVHSPLLDVLLRFLRYKIALTTDVSKMYWAVLLPEDQQDLHHFIWRSQQEPLQDYRVIRLTFGV